LTPDGGLRSKDQVVGRPADRAVLNISRAVQKERLDRFILRDVIKLQADDDPMAPPIAHPSMEVSFVQSHGRTSHAVIEQQPDRAEKVSMPLLKTMFALAKFR
jgi:hypothetical protein